MVRYYTVAVDMADGSDVPDETFKYHIMALARYSRIKLSAKGVVYKSLSVTTNNGDEILARESFGEA